MATKDQTLVRQTLAGETAAFDVLVERYGGLVYSLILEVVRQPENVEDLAQEAFCKAYQGLAGLRRPAKFPAWLGRIAYHTAMRWLKKERARSQAEATAQKEDLYLGAAPPDEQFETHQQAGILWEALDQLPPEHRRVVVLYHLEGCTFRQVARFLGKPLATVRWRLLQAERRLGQNLGRIINPAGPQGPQTKRRWQKNLLLGLPLASPSEAQAPARWSLAFLLRALPFSPKNTVVLGFLGSILLHLLGLSVVEKFERKDQKQSPLHFVLPAQLPLSYRSGGPADTSPQMEQLQVPAEPQGISALILDEGSSQPPISFQPPEPLRQLETDPAPLKHSLPASPLVAKLAELALAESVLTESLELLRLKDLEQTGRHHGAIIPDPADRRQLRGYLHLTYIQVYGAGSYSAPGDALADLARYMRDNTHIQTRISDTKYHRGFLSSELLKYPIHFLFQGQPLSHNQETAPSGTYPYDQDKLTKFSKEEIALLGRYLQGGGFLYTEGSRFFLSDMVKHVRVALKGRGRLKKITTSHPIYHSFFDFDSGFPGEHQASSAPYPQSDRYYASTYPRAPSPYPHGLWGVELDGEMVAVFNDNGILSNWEPDIAEEGQTGKPWEGPVKSPDLQAATNIVVYALTRPHSLAARRERPLWRELSRAF